MTNIAVSRIQREFKEIISSEEVCNIKVSCGISNSYLAAKLKM